MSKLLTSTVDWTWFGKAHLSIEFTTGGLLSSCYEVILMFVLFLQLISVFYSCAVLITNFCVHASDWFNESSLISICNLAVRPDFILRTKEDICHTCLSPVTRISDYWTHLDSITSVITFPISVWFPALFPASALIAVCRCVPVCWRCSCFVICLFLNKCWLPVPAAHLRRRLLQYLSFKVSA